MFVFVCVFVFSRRLRACIWRERLLHHDKCSCCLFGWVCHLKVVAQLRLEPRSVSLPDDSNPPWHCSCWTTSEKKYIQQKKIHPANKLFFYFFYFLLVMRNSLDFTSNPIPGKTKGDVTNIYFSLILNFVIDIEILNPSETQRPTRKLMRYASEKL